MVGRAKAVLHGLHHVSVAVAGALLHARESVGAHRAARRVSVHPSLARSSSASAGTHLRHDRLEHLGALAEGHEERSVRQHTPGAAGACVRECAPSSSSRLQAGRGSAALDACPMAGRRWESKTHTCTSAWKRSSGNESAWKASAGTNARRQLRSYSCPISLPAPSFRRARRAAASTPQPPARGTHAARWKTRASTRGLVAGWVTWGGRSLRPQRMPQRKLEQAQHAQAFAAIQLGQRERTLLAIHLVVAGCVAVIQKGVCVGGGGKGGGGQA